MRTLRTVPVTTAVARPSTAAAAAASATPQWLLLGRREDFGPRPRLLDVAGSRVVAVRDRDRVLAAPDACPHRGASLAGGHATRGGCVVCPYHGHTVSLARGYAVRTDAAGDVWLDFTGAADDAGADPPPPPPPEFTAPGFRTIAYAKDLPGVNPVLLTENTLDHAHLFHVHAVHFVPGPPKVALAEGGGLATYAWAPSGRYQLSIENEYRLPFTTWLRFLVTDTHTGARLKPLVLWFTAAPVAGGTRLHLRIARAALTHPAFDWLFKLIDELPLAEDAAIVRGVDARAWSANALRADDAFVAQYRAAMRGLHPDLLDAHVR